MLMLSEGRTWISKLLGREFKFAIMYPLHITINVQEIGVCPEILLGYLYMCNGIMGLLIHFHETTNISYSNPFRKEKEN